MSSLLITTVVCPQCHAEVDARAALCGHCGGQLVKSEPVASGHLPDDARLIDRPWLILVVLLHVGFLGIPLFLKTRYSLTTRIVLCFASVVYTLLAVAGIVWGLAQIMRALPASS